ncbi:MAG: phosphoribosylamine--glycine ligase [Actinobacteria bacterium]|nr:phosphoribosylamine--glycine ligase [Actinomycetota bacterium]
MRILVVGSGGREHALVHRLKQEGNTLFATGVNAGIISELGIENCFAIDIVNSSAVVELANNLKVDLVVIGPEAPLVAGVSNALRDKGILVFGPDQDAAKIEASKAFAKELMVELEIPTAQSVTCQNAHDVVNAIIKFGAPYVIKDDGLAAGKGVVVTDNQAEALTHAQTCFLMGNKVVVEEFLTGEEVSVLCVTDGETVYPLLSVQDYKRIFDGDIGPNTGGMGAYSPVSWFSKEFETEVVNQIAQPIVNKLASMGSQFIGVLYCGLIRTNSGLKVIEFNARFGDPETQVVLALLQSSLTDLLHKAASAELNEIPVPSFAGSAITVVLASAGYPESSRSGDKISIEIPQTPNLVVFHAGTKIDNGAVKTAGGRVLAVTATGSSIAEARKLAYQGVAGINFAGSQYRSDIGLGK